jgi:hypothetical protein
VSRRQAPSLDIEIPADRSDLSTWSPQQVDTVIGEIQDRAWAVYMDFIQARNRATEYAKYADPTYRGYRAADAERYAAQAAQWEAKAEALREQERAIQAEADPFEAEYRRRPWTRAWIVVSSDGHVHNTRSCSTCNKVYQKRDGTYSDPTRFGWLPQVSGLDEAEIVDLAGEAACTVCYPSAPVGTHSQPNLLDTAERAAAKAARQAEKDALTASRIAKGITPDGTPLVVRWSYLDSRWGQERKGEDPSTRVEYVGGTSKEIKTERAAELWIVETLAAVAKGKPVSYWNAGREQADEVLAALAWKRGTTPEALEASLAKKVAKKAANLY